MKGSDAMFSKLPIIMDGATGTELQRMGMPGGCCTEQWVLDNPDKLIALQRGYVEAGSGMIFVPSFGANRVNLEKHGVEKSVEYICAAATELSREASGGRALVAGDISPTGLLLEPYGDTEADELLEVFQEQARGLEKAGVDLFGLETQMYLDEAALAARAVRSVSDKPMIVSFSCGPTGRTLWGESLADICRAMEEFEISAFGVNCCGDLDVVCSVLEELRQVTDLPLIAKPNAGMPKNVDGRNVYDLPPEELGRYALEFRKRGAGLIGGCCGTDKRHIAAIRDALKKAD